MSFLSSVREAASAGLKMAASMASGTSLPFEQGPQITSYQGIMKMYSGKRENKEGVKEIVSIFMYDLKNKKSDEELALVKNAQRRLRTIKHPYLLRCIDAGEQLDNKGGGIIWIVTEPVQPLEDVIDNLREAPGSIAWGTYTLAAAIKFLNIDCNIVHGQVCMSSLFVDKGMDWKLGGFELLVTAPEANPAYFARAKDVLPKRYQSPEISRGQPEQLEALQRIPVAADWCASQHSYNPAACGHGPQMHRGPCAPACPCVPCVPLRALRAPAACPYLRASGCVPLTVCPGVAGGRSVALFSRCGAAPSNRPRTSRT